MGVDLASERWKIQIWIEYQTTITQRVMDWMQFHMEAVSIVFRERNMNYQDYIHHVLEQDALPYNQQLEITIFPTNKAIQQQSLPGSFEDPSS